MKKIVIDGYEVVTNLGGTYPLGDGNDTATMKVIIPHSNEGEESFVARLAKHYTHVTLKYHTTTIRGYWKLYALVKGERE